MKPVFDVLTTILMTHMLPRFNLENKNDAF
jgi:hypothetical protein